MEEVPDNQRVDSRNSHPSTNGNNIRESHPHPKRLKLIVIKS